MLAVPSSNPGSGSFPHSPLASSRPLPLEMLATPTAWAATLALSAVVGVVFSRLPLLATVHFVGTFACLLGVAFFARRPDPVLIVTIYAGLCDVWWRAAGARAPWEASKYALVIGSVAILVRFVDRPRNGGLTAALLLLLVPGVVVGTSVLGFGAVRQFVVARLGGLIALALMVLACSNLRLNVKEMRGLFLVALLPIVSLAAQATVMTVQATDLSFGDESNSATSGGFGPNQVSSALCFGGLLCILVLLQRGVGWRIRAIASIVGVWIVGQAVLTFSRGGLFGLVLACAAVLVVALTISGQRTRVVVATGLLVLIAVQVLSWAGAFTGGASEERLASTDSTNRMDIAASDIRLFVQQPVLGVGVGVSPFERDLDFFTAPHTEYTRLLAEHGVFGFGVIVVLIAMSVRAVLAAQGWYRMAATGLLVISLSQMMHSATRIGSIAVAFGLASILEDREIVDNR